MITATSKKCDYITRLSDGQHTFYADTPISDGGSDMYQRPGDILASAYAACVNITTRKVLDRENLPYEEVKVYVDIDRSDLDNLKIHTKTEITADISEEKKQEIIQKVKRCPVCRMLAAEKEFLPME